MRKKVEIFYINKNNELVSIALDGSDKKNLANNTNVYTYDGEYLYYINNDGLVKSDLEGQSKVIYESNNLSLVNLVEKKLVIQDKNIIYTMDLDGKDKKKLYTMDIGGSLTFEVVGDKLLVLTKGNSDSVIGYEIVGLDGKRHILDDENQPTIKGNEFYVNAAEGADAEEADADVVIQVAVPAQTTVELCSTEAQAILSQENCIAIFGSNQVAAEGVLAANANLNVLGSDAANGDVIGVGFDAGSIIKAAVTDGTFLGAVTQSPLMMGYYAIYALTAAANGAELEDVPTAGYWYDSTNIDAEDIAPNLYD